LFTLSDRLAVKTSRMQLASSESHLLATHRESQPDCLRRMVELCSRRGYGGYGTLECRRMRASGGATGLPKDMTRQSYYESRISGIPDVLSTKRDNCPASAFTRVRQNQSLLPMSFFAGGIGMCHADVDRKFFVTLGFILPLHFIKRRTHGRTRRISISPAMIVLRRGSVQIVVRR
jgi:hypothetical protein